MMEKEERVSVKLIIAQDVLDMFPDLRIGIVAGRNVNNTGSNADLENIKQVEGARVRQNLTNDSLAQLPQITAWRETYRRFGSKPNSFRPTAEALLRRIIRGEDIPTISTAVDAYLAVEAEFYLPIGGYDLAHIVGDITLRLSPGEEPFTPIGGGEAEEKTYAGEVVYADAEKILTRRWNYRDCDAAKITQASQDIALFCEATLPDITIDQLRDCTGRLGGYLQRFCGGSISSQLIEARQQQETDI
jgi:DNA/RNA-binding domain of Phe-tRNA-synthetase-like protein